MSKKPNLTTREKKTMEIVKNNTNEAVIEAVGELNDLMEDTSQLMDLLYYMSIRKGSVDSRDLEVLISKYSEQVNQANAAIEKATKKKVRVVEPAKATRRVKVGK